jgi:hypothetical protein
MICNLLQISQPKTYLGLDSPLGDIDLVPVVKLDRRSISFDSESLAVALDRELDTVFVVTDAGSKDLLLSSQACECDCVVAGSDARVEVRRLVGSSTGILVVGDCDLERHGASSIGVCLKS